MAMIYYVAVSERIMKEVLDMRCVVSDEVGSASRTYDSVLAISSVYESGGEGSKCEPWS